MGGGGYSGPTARQQFMQQQQEKAMMQMNMDMEQKRLDMQKTILDTQTATAEKQRLAAEEAAEKAAIQSQTTMSQQASQQNMQDVEQRLLGQNTMQQLADQNAVNSYGKSLTSGAENMTGNFDLSQSRQNALQQLGAASGTLPQTSANLTANMYGTNPAAMTAANALNQTRNAQQKYQIPNTSGLTFGGS